MDRTVVDVLEHSNNASFTIRIPADYHPHLVWTQKESIGTSSRARWLQNVLDHFAEELRAVLPEVDSSWRSYSLQCLLVRAFNSVQDDDKEAIEQRAIVKTNPSLKKLSLSEWLHFYTYIDVASSKYESLWKLVKPEGFRQDEGTATSELLHPKPE